MSLVQLRDPEHMNVLGLLLHGFLGATLEDAALADRARKLSGGVWLRAGQMWVTLLFSDAGIEIIRGREEPARASVEGEMDVLLGMVTGGGLVRPMLTGKIGIGGNPLFLLQLLPILIH